MLAKDFINDYLDYAYSRYVKSPQETQYIIYNTGVLSMNLKIRFHHSGKYIWIDIIPYEYSELEYSDTEIELVGYAYEVGEEPISFEDFKMYYNETFDHLMEDLTKFKTDQN